jgi:Leucine-rich repeat (LRR) protein
MEKDKQLMLLQGEQALVRVNVQMGLVDKVLEEDERFFAKVRKVVLRCETVDGFKEFVVDLDTKILDLSSKNITRLPSEIGLLSVLKILILNSNQLTSLPVEINQLVKLEALDLTANQFAKLPVEILKLTNLLSLHIGYNQLCELPMEIIELNNLEILSMYGNIFTQMPLEIGRLSNVSLTVLSWDTKRFALPSKEMNDLINQKGWYEYMGENSAFSTLLTIAEI